MSDYPVAITAVNHLEPVPRRIRAFLGGAGSSVMVFETGLPTRYYLSRTDVDFAHLIPSDTVTSCPHKGTPGAAQDALLPI